MIRHSEFLVFQGPHLTHGGSRRLFRYANNWGASVVQFEWSYGGQQGLWEAMPVRFSGPGDLDWQLAGEPQGHLTDRELDTFLDEIAARPDVKEN